MAAFRNSFVAGTRLESPVTSSIGNSQKSIRQIFLLLRVIRKISWHSWKILTSFQDKCGLKQYQIIGMNEIQNAVQTITSLDGSLFRVNRAWLKTLYRTIYDSCTQPWDGHGGTRPTHLVDGSPMYARYRADLILANPPVCHSTVCLSGLSSDIPEVVCRSPCCGKVGYSTAHCVYNAVDTNKKHAFAISANGIDSGVIPQLLLI